MKKILAFALALLCCIGLAACGEKEDKTEKIGIDVEYYAKIGQIPECEFHLGQSVNEVLKTLGDRQKKYEEENKDGDAHSAEADKYFFYNSENEDNGLIITYGDSGCTYHYNPKKKSEGISYIVSTNKAYEFNIGDVSSEIKAALLSYGFETKERPLTEKEIAAYAANESSTALEYAFEKNTVIFIFNENALFSTVLLKG